MRRILCGKGGHAREVGSFIGEVEYLTSAELLYLNPLEYETMVCIGDCLNRQNVVNSLPKDINYFTFIHPTAIIAKDVEIGEGSFIGAYCIINTGVKIGKHAIINRLNTIGHNAICGDYLSMMPGSIISGDCKIGNCVYLGSNSTIREKIEICDNTIVGLNTGVVKNITESGTYIETPARKLKSWVNNPDGSMSYV